MLTIKDTTQALLWVNRLSNWKIRHKDFLAEQTRDENGNLRPKHERLLKAEYSLVKLVKTSTLFTYLDESLAFSCPSTNNRIEGGINAQLRTMLRNHRGNVCRKTNKSGFLVVLYALTETALYSRNTQGYADR